MTEEKVEGKIEVSPKIEEIVKKIEGLSVLDLAELVKVLEKKFGVSAAPQVVAAPTAVPTTQAAPAAEEKTVFNVVLTAVGDKKIEVIKIIRDVTQKGLKEAKDLVDAVATAGPQMVKENVKKEEAEELKKKFEAAGAKVELR